MYEEEALAYTRKLITKVCHERRNAHRRSDNLFHQFFYDDASYVNEYIALLTETKQMLLATMKNLRTLMQD